MTHIETMMLAVCFGSAVGYTIGNLITLVMFAIDERKAKKRRKEESANSQTSDS